MLQIERGWDARNEPVIYMFTGSAAICQIKWRILSVVIKIYIFQINVFISSSTILNTTRKFYISFSTVNHFFCAGYGKWSCLKMWFFKVSTNHNHRYGSQWCSLFLLLLLGHNLCGMLLNEPLSKTIWKKNFVEESNESQHQQKQQILFPFSRLFLNIIFSVFPHHFMLIDHRIIFIIYTIHSQLWWKIPYKLFFSTIICFAAHSIFDLKWFFPFCFILIICSLLQYFNEKSSKCMHSGFR